MKLKLLGMLLLAPCLMLGCEDDGEVVDALEGVEGAEGAEGSAEGAEGAEGGEAPAAPGPAEVCATIVEGAGASDESTVTENSTDATAEAMPADGAKEAMMAALKDATCGEATEAEDGTTATVQVTSGSETRNIPFIKVDDAWKFDGEAYVKAYPPPAKEEPKGKKKKKKKKRKKKRKSK